MSRRPEAPSGSRCLRWSIRTSFLRYLTALPDARASVTDGARLTQTDPQEVLYAADPENSAQDVLAFQGDLRLSGHGGLLFVRLANPRIHLHAPRATLTVDDPLTEDGSGPRLTLVTLAMTPQGPDWHGTDVRLSEDGAAVFNHVYPAGDLFDPLRTSEVGAAGAVAATPAVHLDRGFGTYLSASPGG